MEKQTAVRFIELKLLGLVSFDSEELRKMYKDIFKQAKEIEKERMKDAWDDGLFGKTDNFQQYYNETFGK
jgi:hypothetical protein